MYLFDLSPFRVSRLTALVNFRRVPSTVWLLGVTSLFTDLSSEMVAASLPGYLVAYLGLSPLAFGAVTGLYDGVTAFVRPAAGVLADRMQRSKPVAFIGYATSAVCKLAWPLVGSSTTGIVSVIAIDRIGKGIRTAPRDALIVASSPRETLGVAFGVHRALDTVGALIGPLMALAVLRIVPGGFDAIFATSFFIALIGVGTLALLVEEPQASSRKEPEPDEASALAREGLTDRTFVKLMTAVFLLGCASINDALIYLSFQRVSGFNTMAIPALYFGTALVFLLFAAPFGALGDRIGRRSLFIGGHVALLLVYLTLLTGGTGKIVGLPMVVLLGMYYASTDGMIAAIAGSRLKPGSLGTGLGTLSAASSLARLIAAVLFGWAWSAIGVTFAITAAAAALTGAILASAVLIDTKAP